MKKFMKKVLSIIICICMIIPTTIPLAITTQAANTGTVVINGAIHFGITSIPYVGKGLDGMFGPMINKAFGIPTTGSISKQIGEISKQINELSVKIDNNHQELLNQVYKNELNDYYRCITRIQSQTKLYYDQLQAIEKDFESQNDNDDVYLEAIKIATISDSIYGTFSDYLIDLNDAYQYLSGEANGMDDGLLTLIYKAYCNDAVLGGEAGYLAYKNVSDIVNCIQKAYFIASMVEYASCYVGENYSVYKNLNAKDTKGDFENYAKFKTNLSNVKGSLNRLNKDYGALFGGSLEDLNNNYYCKEAEIDSVITGGIVGSYNSYLENVRYFYIDGVNYATKPAKVDYLPLENEVKFISATDYGYKNETISKNDAWYNSVRKIGDGYSQAVNVSIKKGLNSDKLNKLINHISNSELFGTNDSNTLTIQQALENYGFSFKDCDKFIEGKDASKIKKLFCTKAESTGSNETYNVNYSEHTDQTAQADVYGADLNATIVSQKGNLSKKYNLYEYSYHGEKAVYKTSGYDDIIAINFQTYKNIDNEKQFESFITDIANGNNYAGVKIILNDDLNLSKYDYNLMWQDSNYKKEFCGTFDGNNHTIKNFSFINSPEHRVALFRTTGEGAVIKNLNFENVNISGIANKNGYAAVIGYANGNTTIDNVTIKSGNITGYKYVAGMIGESNRGKKMTITNCTNNATITSTDTDAAGMIANSGEIYISNCINNGAVTANKGAAGGISGYLGNRDKDPYFYVENCKNTASITGDDCTAGICANLESDKGDTKIIGNENTGAIKNISKRSAGGIVGRTYAGGLFKDNKNSGNVENIVTSNGEAGGILGYNQDDYIKIENNSNSGNITAVTSTGGIAGWLGDRDHDKQCDIIGNSNSGKIKSSSSDAGGIIGAISTDNKNHQVSNNSNTGYISAERQAGGIVGYMAGGGMFESNKNRSDVFSNSQNAGGIVGSIQDDLCEFKKSDVDAKAVVGNPRMIVDYKYLVKAKNTDMHAGKICGWDGKRKSNISSDTLSSSIFGEGSTVIIVSMVAVLVAAGVVIIIVYKKRKQNANLAAE